MLESYGCVPQPQTSLDIDCQQKNPCQESNPIHLAFSHLLYYMSIPNSYNSVLFKIKHFMLNI